MNSFFFWLTIAAAVGALLATTFRPGALEIVIVAAIANLAFYGYRRLTRSRAIAT
jgi:membrane protein implicated in regulation of membrane protease activity